MARYSRRRRSYKRPTRRRRTNKRRRPSVKRRGISLRYRGSSRRKTKRSKNKFRRVKVPITCHSLILSAPLTVESPPTLNNPFVAYVPAAPVTAAGRLQDFGDNICIMPFYWLNIYCAYMRDRYYAGQDSAMRVSASAHIDKQQLYMRLFYGMSEAYRITSMWVHFKWKGKNWRDTKNIYSTNSLTAAHVIAQTEAQQTVPSVVTQHGFTVDTAIIDDQNILIINNPDGTSIISELVSDSGDEYTGERVRNFVKSARERCRYVKWGRSFSVKIMPDKKVCNYKHIASNGVVTDHDSSDIGWFPNDVSENITTGSGTVFAPRNWPIASSCVVFPHLPEVVANFYDITTGFTIVFRDSNSLFLNNTSK